MAWILPLSTLTGAVNKRHHDAVFYDQSSGAVAISVGLLTTIPAEAAPIPFNVGGSNLTSSIQGTVDAFRAALGDPNNGNAPGPLFSGRREINWTAATPR